MRFEVPQFIEIEDKIFGPLTWKQFVYLSGGVGIAVILFLTTNFWIFVLAGVPVGALSIALSFYPVNNRPFSIFLESALQYFGRSKMYYWKRQENVVYRSKERGGPGDTNAAAVPKRDVASLARQLELQAMQKE